MAREFPCPVDPEPIFVRSSEKVWPASPQAHHLALSLVEDDYGTEAAQTVARWLVLYLRGPAARRSSPLRCGCLAPSGLPFATRRKRSIRTRWRAWRFQTWPSARGSSPRHFTRVFTDEVGEAPGAYVERIRTEAARRQLEETDDTVAVDSVALRLRHAETLRRNFVGGSASRPTSTARHSPNTQGGSQ